MKSDLVGGLYLVDLMVETIQKEADCQYGTNGSHKATWIMRTKKGKRQSCDDHLAEMARDASKHLQAKGYTSK